MGLRRFGGPGMHGIGGVPLSSMGGGALGTYAGKVLGYGPIAYWPLWEASGTTAECLVNSLQNGTYSSDVSTWPVGTGIGDGNTAPYFDGANDWISAFSATLGGTFDGREGTIFAWIRPAAGVWTDGSTRYVVTAGGIADFIRMLKSNTNNRFSWRYSAAAVTEAIDRNGESTTSWTPIAITWSFTADTVAAYWNNALQGTSNTLGAWVNALTYVYIGSSSPVPGSPWPGGIAHVSLYDRPLALPTIQDLGSV